MCVCVCVRARARVLCVCVCVCEAILLCLIMYMNKYFDEKIETRIIDIQYARLIDWFYFIQNVLVQIINIFYMLFHSKITILHKLKLKREILQ